MSAPLGAARARTAPSAASAAGAIDDPSNIDVSTGAKITRKKQQRLRRETIVIAVAITFVIAATAHLANTQQSRTMERYRDEGSGGADDLLVDDADAVAAGERDEATDDEPAAATRATTSAATTKQRTTTTSAQQQRARRPRPAQKETFAAPGAVTENAAQLLKGIAWPENGAWPEERVKALVIHAEDVRTYLGATEGNKDASVTSSAARVFSRSGLKSLIANDCLPPADYATRYKTCAAVGNGGVNLLDARNGAAIDKHEAVLRFNDGPTHKFERFVGQKTTYRAINNAWTRYVLDKDHLKGKYLEGTLLTFGNSAKKHFLDMCLSHPRNAPLRILFMDPKLSTGARQLYHKVWKRMEHAGLINVQGRNSAPTGTEGLVWLLAICERVQLYGFHDADVPPGTSYHYHDNVKPGLDAHSFNFQATFLKMLSEASEGRLILCTPGNKAKTPSTCVDPGQL